MTELVARGLVGWCVNWGNWTGEVCWGMGIVPAVYVGGGGEVG